MQNPPHQHLLSKEAAGAGRLSRSAVLRLTAAALAVCLMARDAFAFTPQRPIADAAVMPSVRFVLPDSVAMVDDGFAPSGAQSRPPQVILFQDAHTNASGQFNLAGALERVVRAEGVDRVYIEGGWGDCSLDALKRSADRRGLRAEAERSVRAGVMHGEEFLSLTTDLDFKIIGAENEAAYRRGLEAYASAARSRDAALRYLDRMRRGLNDQGAFVLNPELAKFQAARERYHGGGTAFAEWFGALLGQARRTGVYLGTYPHLKLARRVSSMERSLDPKRIEREERAAVRTLPDPDRSAIEAARPAPAAGGARADDTAAVRSWYFLLEEKLGRETRAYPALNRYIRYLRELREVSAPAVLKELDALEAETLERLTPDLSEKILIRLKDSAALLEKLVRLRITPDEYDRLKRLQGFADAEHLSGFVNALILERGSGYEGAILLKNSLDRAETAAKRFYAAAAERDTLFLDSVRRHLDGGLPGPAVLVTGGFHTAALKNRLREQGIAFVSILPAVTEETDTARYERLLLAQRAFLFPENGDASGQGSAARPAEGSPPNAHRTVPLALNPAELTRLTAAAGPRNNSLEPSRPPGARMADGKHLQVLESIVTELRRIHEMAGWLPAVTVFGSARIPPRNPFYRLAYELGQEMGRLGIPGRTGAGPSIMEAVLMGLMSVAPDRPELRQGIRILLPFEQETNPMVGKILLFDHFLTRKRALDEDVIATVALPGGIGSMDEFFEAMRRGRPLALLGESFWWPAWDAFFAAWKRAGIVEPMVDGRRSRPFITDRVSSVMDFIKNSRHVAEHHQHFVTPPERMGLLVQELRSGYLQLHGWPESVTVVGHPAPDSPLIIEAERLASRLWGSDVPVRIASENGLDRRLWERAQADGTEHLFQSVIFKSDRTGPVRLGPTPVIPAARRILIRDESLHQFLTAAHSSAFVFLPGGFGTMNRLFDIVQLMQVKKVERQPIVLLGRDYWQPLLDTLRKIWLESDNIPNMVNPEDMDIFRVADTAEEAEEALRRPVPAARMADAADAKARAERYAAVFGGWVRDMLFLPPGESDTMKAAAAFREWGRGEYERGWRFLSPQTRAVLTASALRDAVQQMSSTFVGGDDAGLIARERRFGLMRDLRTIGELNGGAPVREWKMLYQVLEGLPGLKHHILNAHPWPGRAQGDHLNRWIGSNPETVAAEYLALRKTLLGIDRENFLTFDWAAAEREVRKELAARPGPAAPAEGSVGTAEPPVGSPAPVAVDETPAETGAPMDAVQPVAPAAPAVAGPELAPGDEPLVRIRPRLAWPMKRLRADAPLRDRVLRMPDTASRLRAARESLGTSMAAVGDVIGFKITPSMVSLVEHRDLDRRLPPDLAYVAALAAASGLPAGLLDPRLTARSVLSAAGDGPRLEAVRKELGLLPEEALRVHQQLQPSVPIDRHGLDAIERSGPWPRELQEAAWAYRWTLIFVAGIDPLLVDADAFSAEISEVRERPARLRAVRAILGLTRTELERWIPGYTVQQIDTYESSDPKRVRTAPDGYSDRLADLAGIPHILLKDTAADAKQVFAAEHKAAFAGKKTGAEARLKELKELLFSLKPELSADAAWVQGLMIRGQGESRRIGMIESLLSEAQTASDKVDNLKDLRNFGLNDLKVQADRAERFLDEAARRMDAALEEARKDAPGPPPSFMRLKEFIKTLSVKKTDGARMSQSATPDSPDELIQGVETPDPRTYGPGSAVFRFLSAIHPALDPAGFKRAFGALGESVQHWTGFTNIWSWMLLVRPLEGQETALEGIDPVEIVRRVHAMDAVADPGRGPELIALVLTAAARPSALTPELIQAIEGLFAKHFVWAVNAAGLVARLRPDLAASRTVELMIDQYGRIGSGPQGTARVSALSEDERSRIRVAVGRSLEAFLNADPAIASEHKVLSCVAEGERYSSRYGIVYLGADESSAERAYQSVWQQGWMDGLVSALAGQGIPVTPVEFTIDPETYYHSESHYTMFRGLYFLKVEKRYREIVEGVVRGRAWLKPEAERAGIVQKELERTAARQDAPADLAARMRAAGVQEAPDAVFAAVYREAYRVNPQVDAAFLHRLYKEFWGRVFQVDADPRYKDQAVEGMVPVVLRHEESRLDTPEDDKAWLDGRSEGTTRVETPLLELVRGRLEMSDAFVTRSLSIENHDSTRHFFVGVSRELLHVPERARELALLLVTAGEEEFLHAVFGESADLDLRLRRGTRSLGDGIRTSAWGGKESGFLTLKRAGLAFPPGIVLDPELAVELARGPVETRVRMEALIARRLREEGIRLFVDKERVWRWYAQSRDSDIVVLRSNPKVSMPGVLSSSEPTGSLHDGAKTVVDAWDRPQARSYRDRMGLSHEYDQPLIIQRWVSGVSHDFYYKMRNAGDPGSLFLSGVMSTRDPDTGERRIYGRFTENGGGEKLMTLGDRGEDLSELERREPWLHGQLIEAADKLEAAAGPQETEFVVEAGKLWFVQTRPIHFSPQAEIAYLRERIGSGAISEARAIPRIEALQKRLGSRRVRRIASVSADPVARAEASTGGAVEGRLVWDVEEARRMAAKGEAVVLVATRPTREPFLEMIFDFDDAGLIALDYGNSSSHEAALSRHSGIPSLIHLHGVEFKDEDGRRYLRLPGGRELVQGDRVVVDGDRGVLYADGTAEVELSGSVTDASHGIDIRSYRAEFSAPYLDADGRVRAEFTEARLLELNAAAQQRYDAVSSGPDAAAAFKANLEKHFIHGLLIQRRREDAADAAGTDGARLDEDRSGRLHEFARRASEAIGVPRGRIVTFALWSGEGSVAYARTAVSGARAARIVLAESRAGAFQPDAAAATLDGIPDVPADLELPAWSGLFPEDTRLSEDEVEAQVEFLLEQAAYFARLRPGTRFFLSEDLSGQKPAVRERVRAAVRREPVVFAMGAAPREKGRLTVRVTTSFAPESGVVNLAVEPLSRGGEMPDWASIFAIPVLAAAAAIGSLAAVGDPQAAFDAAREFADREPVERISRIYAPGAFRDGTAGAEFLAALQGKRPFLAHQRPEYRAVLATRLLQEIRAAVQQVRVMA